VLHDDGVLGQDDERRQNHHLLYENAVGNKEKGRKFPRVSE
jgi:hypothetical protein